MGEAFRIRWSGYWMPVGGEGRRGGGRGEEGPIRSDSKLSLLRRSAWGKQAASLKSLQNQEQLQGAAPCCADGLPQHRYSRGRAQHSLPLFVTVQCQEGNRLPLEIGPNEPAWALAWPRTPWLPRLPDTITVPRRPNTGSKPSRQG